MNVFETLLKIKKDCSKKKEDEKRFSTSLLTVPSTVTNSETTRTGKGNCFYGKLDEESEKKQRRNSYSREIEGHPKYQFKHLETSVSSRPQNSLKTSNSILKEFESSVFSSDADSNISSNKSDSKEINIENSCLEPIQFENNKVEDLVSYGNLIILYENQQKTLRYYESLYKQSCEKSDLLQNSLETLQADYEIEKSSNEFKIKKLLHEIKTLKTHNFDLITKLKQKTRNSERETYQLLRKSARKISQSEIETMKREDLVEQFNNLRVENTELSKKILKQADEMFEKSQETKELEVQKNEFYKDFHEVSQLKYELNEVNEQVVYLLESTHVLKDKIKSLAVMYKNTLAYIKKDEEKEFDEVLNTINSIHEMVELNLKNIYEKKKSAVLLLKNFAGTRIMTQLMNSVSSISTNR